MSAEVADRLRAAADGLSGERVAVRDLLGVQGDAATGGLLLLLTMPCLLPVPGTGTAFGCGLMALGLAMARRSDSLTLPQRLLAMELPVGVAQRVLSTLAKVYEWASRWLKSRLRFALCDRAPWLIAALVVAMGALLVLPIPFGNVLPGIALLALGLGLAFDDGVAVLVGASLASTAIGLATAAVLWVVP